MKIESQSENAQIGATVWVPLWADVLILQMSWLWCFLQSHHAQRNLELRKTCNFHASTGSSPNYDPCFIEFGSCTANGSKLAPVSPFQVQDAPKVWTSSELLQCVSARKVGWTWTMSSTWLAMCSAKGQSLAWGSTPCLFRVPSSATQTNVSKKIAACYTELVVILGDLSTTATVCTQQQASEGTHLGPPHWVVNEWQQHFHNQQLVCPYQTVCSW